MNKKLLIVALLASNQLSAKFAGSIGAGAVARKTTVELEDANKDKIEFENKSNAAYFAGRVFAKAGIMTSKNIFIGMRVSGDFGNDKKENKISKNISAADLANLNAEQKKIKADAVVLKAGDNKYTSKSNISANIGPEVAYKINDKVSVSAAILGSYKNIKINYEGLNIEADKKHHYGVGGLVGVHYNFNKMMCLFVEAGANYIAKKDVKFIAPNDELKFTNKSSVEFGGSAGIALNFGA